MSEFPRERIKTIKDLVFTAAERFGDDAYIRYCENKDIIDRSYNRFKADSCALAAWMEKHFGRQIQAATIGLTSYEYILCLISTMICGNTVVPLNAVNKAEDLADEINRSDTELVFLDARHEADLDTLKKLCPNVKYFVHIHKKTDGMLFLADMLTECEGQEPTTELTPDTRAAILFTSGTTGQSKGVMVSNANFVDNATCEPDLGYRGNKRLSVLPIHHVFCLVCDVMCSFWYGRILCINDSIMRIPKNLKLFKPTESTFVPMIAASILNKMRAAAKNGADKIAIGKEIFGEDFSILYSGGSYLSPEIINGYKEFGIEIAQGYGMTECPARICTGIKNCPKPESVGRLVNGCKIKIVDGEIWVNSPSVMMGYYKNPEETAKTLTPDGWLKTGDLGYVDEDGYVFLTGRKKNLIILSNGENVSPEELENKFALNEVVKEIVVYDKNGVITAEVYPNPDYESDDIKADVEKEIMAVNKTLTPAKQIVGLVLRDTEFEKTGTRKIKRNSITK